ncbi:MAG: hydantoinase/oxoprolinase N-terminal domain-containing protein, partial [Pseudomonadota bacterium]|nr:hydantoinase/oxoprolinase N-terminal domain-containing protein [Pseudomonadota bacterium]
MRFAVDTGGTFTDLIVESGAKSRRMFKAPTTPADPIAGVLDALGLAAQAFGLPRQELLGRGTHFIHATTH